MSVRSKSTINDRITSINQRKSLQDKSYVGQKRIINDRITSINQRQSLQDQKLCRSEANQLLMIVLLLSTKDNHCRIKSYVGQKQINH